MSSSANPDASCSGSSNTKKEKKGMSIEEFRIYDAMASRMDAFHNHFRTAWKMFEAACQNRQPPSGMSEDRFLLHALSFCERLAMHHSIEEQYIFPRLATKMPEFRAELGIPEDGDKGEGKGVLLTQHELIHQGLDGFQAYLEACQDGEEELDWTTLRLKMEGWGEVLWTHLDQEVATLRADNMRKYWTMEEMIEMSWI
ncbi:hypothetical protein jhhlp_004656 [Lomentospora prolificans]|uniref:Hemerythrin-like domain-containing protein n=1 Tax=Lomentospora prolificans TaxID=41688 RepID=A0A2N3NC93_9PEZI|nr:hypothetical protein jhhlp_004656 [Lomentospora prolificans]